MQQPLPHAAQHSVPDDLEALQAAAAADVGAAQILLGQKFFFGEDVERDYRRAREWLNRAASRNEPGAYELLRRVDAIVLGAKELLRQHLQEAARRSSTCDLRFLCLAVAEGAGDASMMAIENYFSGDGVERDYQQTAEWLSRAACNGLPGANQLLRQYLRHAAPSNETPNLEFLQTALEFLQTAATEGVAKAQKLLGELYLSGRGFSCDYQEAIKWLRRAVSCNEPGAKELLQKAKDLQARDRRDMTDRGIEAPIGPRPGPRPGASARAHRHDLNDLYRKR